MFGKTPFFTLYLFALFFAFPFGAKAQTELYFNDREGDSFYLQKKKERKKAESIVDLYGADKLKEIYQKSVTEMGPRSNEACVFTFVDVIQKNIKHPLSFKNYLIGLRSIGIIDDVMFKILKRGGDFRSEWNRIGSSDEESANDESLDNDNLLPFKSFASKYKNKKCLQDNFRTLYTDYRKENKRFKVKNLRSLARAAFRQNIIDEEMYQVINLSIKNKVDRWQINLSDYLEKKRQLRKQYPLILSQERSNFVTLKAGKKVKATLRQRLFESYSYLQIVMMGNVIKRLKERLDSNRIEITVYDQSNNPNEVIPLDPMERFRFAIRILRKEMKDLSNNHYFNGMSPSYMDLITAAFELGIISSVEVDEVAKMETIWNPKKTFWEKAQLWVRLGAGVGAIVIPPPFGFIPALALVVLEAIFNKQEPDFTHSLF